MSGVTLAGAPAAANRLTATTCAIARCHRAAAGVTAGGAAGVVLMLLRSCQVTADRCGIWSNAVNKDPISGRSAAAAATAAASTLWLAATAAEQQLQSTIGGGL